MFNVKAVVIRSLCRVTGLFKRTMPWGGMSVAQALAGALCLIPSAIGARGAKYAMDGMATMLDRKLGTGHPLPQGTS